MTAAVVQLASRSVELMDAPPIPGFDRTQFRDPFGNLIELIQPASVGAVPRTPGRKPIKGARIELVPHHPDWIEAVFEAVAESIAEISPWMDWCHPRYSIEDSKTWVSSQPAAEIAHEFMIIDSRTHAVIGSCGINRINVPNRFVNLGY